MTKELVKQDINCLEYPLWFQDDRFAEKQENGYMWKNSKGFIISTSLIPPVKTDIIFLLYLLSQSQKRNWKDEIKLTRYQVIKECGLNKNAQWYSRLEESLKRWERVKVEFNGCFYDGKLYKTIHFGVIDSWSIEEGTKLLRVRFSPEYLLTVKNTTYFKYIDFDQIKTLRSSLATRLYQLLIKTFLERSIWKIDSVLLAEKIPMKERYPAQIVKKVKPAVKRIYNHTNLKVTVEDQKKARGKIILIFKKEFCPQSVPPMRKNTLPFTIPNDEAFKKLISLFPSERQRQKTLLELAWKVFNEKGFDFVAWNIEYANRKSIGNYPAYFSKCLRGNYGAFLKEEEEIKQLVATKQIEAAKARQLKLAKAQAKRNQNSIRVQEYLDIITPEERESIDRKAYEKLPTFLKEKSFEETQKDNSITFVSLVRMIALENLKARETAPLPSEQPTETAE